MVKNTRELIEKVRGGDLQAGADAIDALAGAIDTVGKLAAEVQASKNPTKTRGRG